MIKMKRFQTRTKSNKRISNFNRISSSSIKYAHLFLTLLVLGFCLYSCDGRRELDSYNIQELSSISNVPPQHYNRLSSLSSVLTEGNKEIDAIRFPKKAHALTIKAISTAYLEMDEINELINEIKPPSNSSEQTRAELDFLLDLQESRTKHQVDEALRMHDIVYFPILGMKNDDHLFFELYEVLGKEIDISKYPKTQNIMNNIMKEMRVTEFTAKNKFLRARPRQLESKLTPLKKMSSSSFASGHTLWAYMQAYLFSELIPEKKSEFLKLAYDIGFSREILGVHYPSDEEASRKLAHQLLLKMWEKEEFKYDFIGAKSEWVNK